MAARREGRPGRESGAIAAAGGSVARAAVRLGSYRAPHDPPRGSRAPAGAETVAARGVITAPVAMTGAIAVGHGGCGRSGEAVRAECLARRARWSVSS